ncbi:MAG: glycosyltransferase family 4 protein [Bacteroidia bacterium]|nr:glycosyltransferase family 4 protein [Bacteroidia bacterium]
MKKVLLITYYWPPSGGAGVQRWLKFVKFLSALGVKVTVITVDADQATYPATDYSLLQEIPETVRIIQTRTSEPFGAYKKIAPGGQIPQAGFSQQKKNDFILGIAKFIRGNFFIPDARKGWNKHAYNQATSLIKQETFDAVITTSPPHSTQLIGLKLKQQFGLKWIADLRDPWTDIYYYKELKHTFLAKKIDHNYEKKVIEQSDAVLVVSDHIRQLMQDKSAAIDPHKIKVIPNGYDESDLLAPAKQKQPYFTLTYVGTIAPVYQFGSFIHAIEQLASAYQKPIKLQLVGTAPEEVLSTIANSSIATYFEHIPYVPHHDAIGYMKAADALLLAIPNVPDNAGILTGKLFEYMASGVPIAAIGPLHGNAASIINQTRAGKMFDYAETHKIALYLQQIAEGTYPYQPDKSKIKGYDRKQLTQQVLELI